MKGRIRVRVRYGETDCMGRAYHANYLTWFECGRVELLREQGFDYARVEREDGCFLPVFDASVRFRAPALFDDELEITTRIVDYSFVRLTFAYEARRLRDDLLCAEGRTVLVAVDPQGEPRKLPADLHAYLTGLPLPPERERRRRE
ncbi:MAG: acyl-CoA thioesterase [Planctomycetota bacterium]|jgi:acyl-CoA thioester hydrolase